MFDRIISFSDIETIGVKCITAGEDFFSKHYDKKRIMPESLLIESLAQVGGWSITVRSEFRLFAIMCMVNNVKYYKLVKPGDRLFLRTNIIEFDKHQAIITGEILSDGEKVVTIERITYILVEIPKDYREEVKRRYLFVSEGLPGGYRGE